MEFIFSQAVGLIVSVVAVLSMYMKDVKKVLILQLICNALGAISYILLDGLSGCAIFLLAIVQTMVYFFFRKKDIEAPAFLTVVFVCAYLICSLCTYKAPQDIISALAAVTCAFALAQKKPSVYRIFMALNGAIWSMYDISVAAYTMIITHAITSISAIIGIISLDLKKKSK